MRKIHELADLGSCLNRARLDEHVFVLLGRDASAPVAIRAWAAERVRLGKNKPEDEQIVGALNDALSMESEATIPPALTSIEKQVAAALAEKQRRYQQSQE